MCHPENVPLTALADLNLTADESSVLDLVRHFFLNFADPGSQNWIRGVALTHAKFADDRAWPIFTATLQMVMAMRNARRSAFLFSNPHCACCASKATDNERQFLSVLRAARTGRMEAVEGHAMLLCEGNDTNEYVMAAQNLATVLSDTSHRYDSRLHDPLSRPDQPCYSARQGSDRHA